MGVYNASGTRVAKSAVSTSTPADPEVVIGTDLWVKKRYSDTDPVIDGSLREILVKSGTVVRQSQLNAWFPPATVDTISPATGVQAGGTVVTLTGTNLDGVTAITFGGTAATAVTVVSATSVTCHAPAHAAGAVNVVVTDDSGTVTKTAGYTYT